MTNVAEDPIADEALVQRALEAQAHYMPDVCAEVGPIGGEWITAEAFFSNEETIGEFLAFEQSLNRNTDLKTAGALVMTDYGYILAAAAVPLFAGFGLIPELSPASVALAFYTTEELHDEKMHRSRRAHVRFVQEKLWPGQLNDATDEERLRRELEHHFSFVVDTIHIHTRLSRGALWRLAADAIAGRFLDAGRHFGTVGSAKASAMRILKSAGSPFANKQLHYFELTVLDKRLQDFSYTFRQRGGCCRYYMVEGGEYCPTCVLKTPAERDEELRHAMRKHLGVVQK